MNWARRLKRVFGIEIESCARFGGKLRIIARIEEPQVIARILSHLERTAPPCSPVCFELDTEGRLRWRMKRRASAGACPASAHGQGTAGSAFEASPSFLITALGNKLSVAAERELREVLDLALMEWKVLAVLAVEPAAPPSRIIEVSGVNKAAVSRAVNSLETRGLLRRTSLPIMRCARTCFSPRAVTRYASGARA